MKKPLVIFLNTLALTIIICAALCAIIVVGVGVSCSYTGSITGKNFEKVNIGDTVTAVIDKMGQPTIVEHKNSADTRFGMDKCEGNCFQRFWYDNPPCSMIDFWLVEFDKNGKVFSKYHFSSP